MFVPKAKGIEGMYQSTRMILLTLTCYVSFQKIFGGCDTSHTAAHGLQQRRLLQLTLSGDRIGNPATLLTVL
jgi:hypothetical protein